MKYRILSELGNSYRTEESSSTVDRGNVKVWGGIEKGLKEAILRLREAEGAGAPAGKSVKDLIQFHESRVKNPSTDPNVKKYADEIRFYRTWLSREGVRADENGNVICSCLRPLKVVYDRDLQKQGLTKIHFRSGRLYIDSACTKPLNTKNMVTHFTGPGNAIFVMSGSGSIHVISHVVGHRHHSSILAGQNVACAGEIAAADGHLIRLSNKSGHYTPNPQHLLQILHQLQKLSVSMTFQLIVHYSAVHTERYANVGAFLNKRITAGERDLELLRLLDFTHALTPQILGEKNWRLATARESAGVYDQTNNQRVPHKAVRRWLKTKGYQPRSTIYQGTSPRTTQPPPPKVVQYGD